jgi:hypothetical protein
MRSVYKTSVEKPEGKVPFGKPRRRWRIILECILKKQLEGVDWIQLVQDKVQ